ncbi:MAG: NAD(P) transhydrogenase subunit alpha [Miltoncostaeaceae bacterium]
MKTTLEALFPSVTAAQTITSLFILSLAGFVGFEVIRRIPKLLHTPLMALTNAIAAIVLVASMLVLGRADELYLQVMGFIAVVASTLNAVGGFIITDRMLRMFKSRERGASR